ncbi:MAG: translocation/assembly module TamB [Meiothermus sp.]|uniref:translocation/assembly module TamB domain-containing protein n=1 Tax=Meiothermus sp. TaxID=1955249 RepID=UPI0026025088|nr:translocation/assembly module TamB domain-containing protein [Meiothermus sp.]MCS7059485.1 translocation/assembly module TamB [Meiothermus sp.]
MRFLRWAPLFLLLLVGLPAFPPLITYVLQEGLRAAGFRATWRAAGGYLLVGFELREVRLEGRGLRLEAGRLRLGYNLLGLRRKELPLRIWAEEGDLHLSWEALLPQGAGSAPPSLFSLRIDELALNRVSVQLEEGKAFPLPPLRAVVRGSGPYQVVLNLPEGRLSAVVYRTGRELEAWQVEFRGDLRAARYWFSGLESGEVEGSWTVGPQVKNGVLGRNRIKNASVRLVGFALSQIYGEADFDGQVVTANLVGRGLDGPLRGSATVDLPRQEYRFRVEGRPTLPALAQHFGLRLPVEGGGPLVLEGRGWQRLELSGRYSGEGRLLGEPLTYEGTLAFDQSFRLDAVVDGAIFDRTFQARVALRDDAYTVTLRDVYHSNLRLWGKGPRLEGQGVLVWPRPLLGEAELRFLAQGGRWSLEVLSEGVGLPLARPFSLSGRLEGEGPRVGGRLGELELRGFWDDLSLRLGGLEMLVGRLSGSGRFKAGRFSAELGYDSPYTRFPIALRQEGSAWRISSRYGEGSYAGGVLSLEVRELPIALLEPLRLSADVRYGGGRLSGTWGLRGERVQLVGELYDLATRYRGVVQTPFRPLRLEGTANAEGLQARLETLRIRADGEGLRIEGPLRLTPQLRLEAGLGLRAGGYTGEVRFDSPWLEGRLEGRGEELWLSTEGYARLSGPIWPVPNLTGRLTLPSAGGVEVEEVPLWVGRSELRWPEGRVLFRAGFPFEGALPLRMGGQPARLWARGNLEGGQLELTTPYGRLAGRGLWRSLGLQGRLAYGGYWGELRGQLDLPRLAYQGRLRVPELEGEMEFRGQGAQLTYAAQLQNGRLRVVGDYQPASEPLEGLRLRLIAADYSLEPWGFPGRLRGGWSERGGQLTLDTPYGQARLSGTRLLGPVRAQLESPYARLQGWASLEGLDLRGSLRLPYLRGTLAVYGPWENLSASGQGTYGLPYLEPLPWRFEADVLEQTWRLEGPLALSGRGLSYRGRVSWPYRWQGRGGVVEGELAGKALELWSELRTTYAGLPLKARLEAYGADLSRLRATLSLPEGQVEVEGLRAYLDLETGPLARTFAADVQGRLRGWLDLEGRGELEGRLWAYGQEVQVDYKDRSLSAFLPQYHAGVLLELEPGRPLRLVGTGDLEGELTLGERLEGRLAYRGPHLEAEAELGGSPQRPQVGLELHTPWTRLRADGSYTLAQQRGQAKLEVEGPYAQAQLSLYTLGSRYQASGRLVGLRYLEQSGPLRVFGEGASWGLVWDAPLRLEAEGQGVLLRRARVSGQGQVEALDRRFTLAGRMDLLEGSLDGRLQLRGEQVDLALLGQGPRVLAQGRAYGAVVRASAGLDGALQGDLAYRQGLGVAALELQAGLGGSLSRPELRGQGRLVGRGAEIALRFGYREGLWAEAWGAGLSARLENHHLRLNFDGSLEPFLGLPLHLVAQGEGPWEGLELPLRLTGPNLLAEGSFWPARLEGQLAGRYERQRFEVFYDGQLRLRLEGPYATGLVRWAAGAPSGLVSLDFPVVGGRWTGRADLEEGRVWLEGREGWQGRLQLRLREGWSQPGRWVLEAQARGPWSGPADLRFEGRFELDASPLALRGDGSLWMPEWGRVELTARGQEVDLRGRDGLDPLLARIDLNPLRLSWSYGGALPRGLGSLEAQGVYPGRWLVGRYRVAGQEVALEGQEDGLRLQAPGLEARLSPGSLWLRLEGYRPVEGLYLSGGVEGPWGNLQADLGWEGGGRKGKVVALWQEGRLEAQLEGDLSGAVAYNGAWSGRVAFREGYLELSGTGLPVVDGQVLGMALRLAYPSLQLARPGAPSSLQVNLAEASASGELPLGPVEVRGRGGLLEAVYPFAEGSFRAELDLRTYEVRLSAPELGTGMLLFSKGQLSGGLKISLYGLEVALEGAGRELQIRATHPETPWLPWRVGALEGQVGLDGAWRLVYSDAKEQRLQLEGRLLEARLLAQGPWLEGQMGYAAGAWQGRLRAELPLEPLASRLQLELEGRGALEASGNLSGDLGRLRLEARLAQAGLEARAGFSDLALEEVPWISTRLPFIQGRVTGLIEYAGGRLVFGASSPALRVKGDDLALASRLSGSWEGGSMQAELSLERPLGEGSLGRDGIAGSQRTWLRLRVQNHRLQGEARAVAFPLHWLFSTWAGDLAGQAFWTGQARFSLDLANPWASQGVLVGERLRFQGGGDALVGSAALRFEGERLYIDHLALTGKGTWSGSGYYGRRGSNLRLDLENTVFTPVLQVLPNLKPLAPEGSGTLRLRSSGQVFDLTLENFRFKLGPVQAETPRAVLRVADTASAEGRILLTAPFPAQAQLSGEGSLNGFTVRASGTANPPLLNPGEPFDLSFSYPAYTIDASLRNQRARLYGTLFPQLVLTLQGLVPVSYPRYFLLEGLLDTNLILRYQRGVYIAQGAVEVLRARLGLPEGQQEVSIPASEPKTPPAAGVPLEFANIQFRAERGVLIQESLVQGELAGEVYLGGSLADPYLSGEVVPLRGNFKLWDRDFTVRDRGQERSYARFSPSAGILPELQIVADTTVQDRGQENRRVQINLTLKGEFLRQNGRIKVGLTPSFTAWSNGELARKADGQAYTDAEIYALLLLGRSDLSALPADIAQTGLQAAVQNFIVGQLERELAKALGLDQVRVEIPALNGGTLEETRFTIGRYLLPELFFAYSVDLRGYQTVFAEYQQGDLRFRFSSEVFPQPRPELTLGYTLRPLGADLTLDIATGVGDGARGDGVRFGIGITFRF